jgi:hypothetical protein
MRFRLRLRVRLNSNISWISIFVEQLLLAGDNPLSIHANTYRDDKKLVSN